MSYILDALKKSDQQRQRGATPTLQAAQLTVAAPRRPLLISYGLLAVVLLVTGVMIGWLRPWQAERQPPAPAFPGTEAVAAKPPMQVLQQAPGYPAREPTPAAQAVPTSADAKTSAPVNSGTPGAAAPVADDSARPAAPQQKALRFDELPVQIQREIPAMTVQLHAYSSLPSERIVYINSTKLQEGDSLIPGLMLEQITPDGMIFSYKGYRFQHGIR
jgi:general secretion pathway protein B